MIVDWTDDVVGAKDFVAWFGHVPSFHDAYLRDFHVSKDRTAWSQAVVQGLGE